MLVDARGLRFEVREGGPADGEPVLLLHGFPQHSGEWDQVVPELHAAGLRTYALDQRGYSPGARPADVAAYRIEECVADVCAVLDALGLDSAHLVGHDWGAIVAWHLAARHPQRVRTLTAVSVPHPEAVGQALRDDVGQKLKSWYIRLFRRAGLAEKVLLSFDAAALRLMFTGLPAEQAAPYVDAMRAPGALTAGLNWYRAITPATYGDVGPVTVPTTYVWSTRDAALGGTAAHACAHYVTGDYRFVELPGVSHWIPDEAPAPLAAAIRDRVTG
ncbi:alpha/beta fold hydrolase [Melissospora conviva]|uniref:alpha/beta fold hydrolase n=1 Tax=Melissospora conviva TaxID=3388432 RepID=UPI003C1D81D6